MYSGSPPAQSGYIPGVLFLYRTLSKLSPEVAAYLLGIPSGGKTFIQTIYSDTLILPPSFEGLNACSLNYFFCKHWTIIGFI